MKPRHVVLLGLDSVIPGFARRFAAQGYMPNLARLLAEGFWTETIPTTPPWTPPGWASVATGAWPSTHGVEGFGVYFPGEPLAVQHEGFDSAIWKAEAIWEAAARGGKKTLLLKYPGMWPHKEMPLVSQIGGVSGFAGRRSELDLTHAMVYGTTLEDSENTTRLRASDGGNEAETWVLPIRPLADEAQVRNYRVMRKNGTIAIHAEEETEPMARLRVGEWSEVRRETFAVKGDPVEGAFRFKLLEDDGAEDIRILMSQNHPLVGYSTPDALAEGLAADVGGVFDYSESYYELFKGLIDDETFIEVAAYHAEWHEKTMRWLAGNEEWDLMVTQSHIIDNFQHTFWAGIDDKHPLFEPATADHYWDVLGRAYTLVDQLIGAGRELAGDDGLLVVTGDHGHEPRRYTFQINNWLARNGYLTPVAGDNGLFGVDWSTTRAIAMGPIHIMLNVEGRNPDGVVKPGSEYDRLCAEIANGLYDVRFGDENVPVLQGVFMREEMDALGLYGDGVGDLIYSVRSGFDVGASMRLESFENYGLTADQELFVTSVPFRELTSQHCSVTAFSKQNRTWTLFAGAGVKSGIERRIPIRLVDIAPTICFLAGFPYPAQVEGQVIVDLVDDTQP